MRITTVTMDAINFLKVKLGNRYVQFFTGYELKLHFKTHLSRLTTVLSFSLNT